MKQITLYIILLSLSALSPATVFGAEDCSNECTIKDAPAKVLRDYIADSKTILGNISDQAMTGDKISSLNAQKKLIQIYNYYIFNWDSFFTRFRYNVLFPLGNEIPTQIQRDYALLQDQIDYQNNIIYRLAQSGYINTPVSNVCGDIKNCNLAGSAGDVAAQVLANTNRLANLYRLSVSGNLKQASKIEIQFGENIKEAILTNYSPEMVVACSKCEGATLDTVTTSLKNISFNTQGYKKGVQEWKDGWALITGEFGLKGGTTQSNQEQKDALKKELKRQGVSQNTNDVLLGNLEKYQSSKGSFVNNNFIVHSIMGIGDSFTDAWNSFEEAQKGEFDNSNNTTAVGFNQTAQSVAYSDDIAQIVSGLYNSQKDYALTQDNASGIALTRVIAIHTKLTSALENIGEIARRDAEAACKEQLSDVPANCSAQD